MGAAFLQPITVTFPPFYALKKTTKLLPLVVMIFQGTGISVFIRLSSALFILLLVETFEVRHPIL